MKRNTLIEVIIIWLLMVNIPISEGSTSEYQTDTHPTRSEQNYSFPMYKGDMQRTARCNIDTSDNPGMLIWKYNIGTGNIKSSPVIGPDGVIYCGDAVGRFHAVYPNGTRKWIFTARTPIEGAGAISNDGVIYFGTYNEKFYSVWTSNGSERWSIDIGGVWGSPLVLENGTILVNGIDKGLCMIDVNGNIIWSIKIGVGYSSPALRHDGIIVIGSHDGHLYAVYPNGSVMWKCETAYTTSTPAVDSNNNTYTTAWDGFLYSVYPNGTVRWKKYLPGPTGQTNFYASPAIDHDENIICLTPRAEIHKYSNNGSLIWSSPTQGYPWNSPVIDFKSNIYYTTPGARLVGKYSNKTKKFDIFLDGASYTTPAIGKDGVMYINDGSGTLFAFSNRKPLSPILSIKDWGDKYNYINWTYPEEGGLPIYSDISLPPPLKFVNIYRNQTGTEPQLLTTINLSENNSSEYRDEDVINGVEYTYSITSVSIYGESDRSNAVTAIPRTVPGVPSDLEAIEGNGFVNLSWSPPVYDGGGEIIRYRIERRDGENSFQHLSDTDPSVLFYNDTSAENGVVYTYRIFAVNIVGSSPPGSIVAGPKTVPGNPIFQLSPGDDQIVLTWEDPDFDGGSDILGFRVYKKENDQINMIAELENNVHEFVDHNVVNGNEYHYTVTAFNDRGESKSPVYYKAIPRGKPSSPFGLSGRTGNGFVLLSWTEPLDDNGSPVIYYVLNVTADMNEKPFHETYWIDHPTTQYNDTNVINGVDYTYSVRAINSIGESLPSNSITLKPSTVPSSPENFTSIVGDSFISLSWSEPLTDGGLPINGYRIYREEGLFDFELLVDLDATTKSFNDTTVENGITYSYYVVSINENGPSVPSDIVNGVPTRSLTVPSVPDNLTYVVGEDFVHLYWGPPEDDGGSSITEYRIYKGVTSDSVSIFRTVGPETTDLNDTSVEPGITYYYYVTCINEKGESDNSSLITITTLNEISNPSNGHTGILFAIIAGIIVLILLGVGIYLLILRRRKLDFHPKTDEGPLNED